MPTDSSAYHGLPAPLLSDAKGLGGLRIRQLRDRIEAVLTAYNQTPWDAYVPSTGGLTLGNGTLDAAWTRRGTLVIARGRLVLGSTSDITATLGIGLPVAPKAGAYATGSPLGNMFAVDASVGSGSRLIGNACLDQPTGRVFFITSRDTAPTLNASTPWDWAQGDELAWNLMYETVPAALP